MASFQNQATLFSNNAVALSNIVYGEINEAYSMTKIAVKANYVSCDSITYVVTITNNGGIALAGLTLTDNLGAYTFGANTLTPLDYVDGTLLYYVNGTLQPTPTIAAEMPLVVTGISVPVNGNATIIYEAKVNLYAPISVGGRIVNTATLTGEAITTDIRTQSVVTVRNAPVLSITKAINPTAITDGDVLTYTFTIQNSGNSAANASEGIRIVDNFEPTLNISSVTLNGVPFADYTYTNNVFSTDSGSITVPAATITQNPTSGVWYASPGVSILIVRGTV